MVQRSHCCLHAAQRVRCLTIRTFRRRSLQNTLAHNGHSSIHWELQTWCVHPCLERLSATLPNLVRIRRVASSSAHVQSFLSFFQNATKYSLVQQIMPEAIANTTTRRSTNKNTSMQSVTTEKEREWARHAASLDAQIVTNKTQELHGHVTKHCLVHQTFLRNCERGKRLLCHTRPLIKRRRLATHHFFKPPCRTRRIIICDVATVQTRIQTSCAPARPHLETTRHEFRTPCCHRYECAAADFSARSNHLTKSENTLDKHKSY